MVDRVLIDTCIWASVFAKPGSRERQTTEQLIEENRVVVVGPVLAEVLHGFRRREQAEWAASRLRSLIWIDIPWEDWVSAASLGRQPAGEGYRLPLADLLIVAIARRHRLLVYSNDPHFDLVLDLKRYPE